ncbi:olfactory receptor 8D1-like [Pseudophryne corroboree]|uniref:olfactory receptor 8D1-like n=1 Tax=Pseudophryne corroboree TaxID=495146 RepID=UPI00308202B5
MNSTNQMKLTYFIIRGISDDPVLQVPISFLVLLIYLTTLGGNMTILLLICFEHHLHSPMYFFLANLSILDISSTTITLHKVFVNLISQDKTISLQACMAQMYMFAVLTGDELLLLTAMSYDRYVAICNPLCYHLIMNFRFCALLAVTCWILGFLEAIPHVVILSGISCYRSREINHFFCDLLPLIKLSCSDTSIIYLIIFISGLIHFMLSFIFTFIPYIYIIFTILNMQSSSGRHKAFYTCSQHFTVVILLYTTLILQYLRPTALENLDYNKLFSAAVPMLNPLIYSLKNKDVKTALRQRLKLFGYFKG